MVDIRLQIGHTSGTVPTIAIQGNTVTVVSSNGTNSTTLGYTGAQAAGNITCPFIIVHAGEDTVVPVANAPQLFEAIAAKDKHLKILSAEDGGYYHAQADNRQVGIDYIADWISDRV